MDLGSKVGQSSRPAAHASSRRRCAPPKKQETGAPEQTASAVDTALRSSRMQDLLQRHPRHEELLAQLNCGPQAAPDECRTHLEARFRPLHNAPKTPWEPRPQSGQLLQGRMQSANERGKQQTLEALHKTMRARVGAARRSRSPGPLSPLPAVEGRSLTGSLHSQARVHAFHKGTL